MPKKLIITGSPHPNGRSARIAKGLVARYLAEDPETAVTVYSLAENHVGSCTACDACKDDFHCIIDDDMQSLYPLLDATDDLTVVSPVFFSGPPSQYKALLDRLQVYFWRSMKDRASMREKRPLHLYVVGEGGDPHGFEPLVICSRSALAVAGFRLDDIYNGVQRNGEELDDIAAHPENYRYDSPSRK